MKNAGNYRGSMNVTDALATSPNTAFAKLISQVGVQRTVDMAVKLGLRSYALPGTARDYDPDEQRKPRRLRQAAEPRLVHAGPDRGQRARVLQRGGHAGLRRRRGARPNPIDKVFDRRGKEVSVTTETCEQVVPEGLANTLANALSKDDQGAGTAAGSAGSAGWDLPMSGKTGTTEAHRSSAFLGFTNTLAAANYIYDDSTSPGELCSFPLRQCGSGDLFGGNEPARTWFTAMKPIANNFGEVKLPPTDPRYVDGAPGSKVPSVSGMNQDLARTASQGGRLPGGRSGHLGQQRLVGRHGGWHVAVRADRAGLDHHPPGQQRHPAATTTTAGGPAADPGSAAGCGLDGGGDPRPAADHGADTGAAAARGAATSVNAGSR